MDNKCLFNCFLHKNTEEIRNKLNRLGYKQLENGAGEWHIPITELPYIKTGYDKNFGNYYAGTNGCWDNNVFDCGTNQIVFFIIASLKEGNEYVQQLTDSIQLFE